MLRAGRGLDLVKLQAHEAVLCSDLAHLLYGVDDELVLIIYYTIIVILSWLTNVSLTRWCSVSYL